MPENLNPELFLRYTLKTEHARHVRKTDGTVFNFVIDPDRDLRPRSNRRWRMIKARPQFSVEIKQTQSLRPK
jgi:hypothetical protein